MTTHYRVAVIGAGSIAKYSHVPGFKRLSNCEVVALCDVNETRARELAAETGVLGVYSDAERMLAEQQPEIVVVATPNAFHKPMSMAALRAGAHVLCEKPLALTYADALEMFDLAAQQQRILTVGTHLRFSAPMQAAKAHVDAGFFGKIYAARTVWQRRNGIPGFGSWFTNHDLAGGGSLLDIGIHALDRALYLMGYPEPVTVSGASFAEFGPRAMGLGGWGSDIQKLAPDARYDVDDFSWAMVRFANGAVLSLQVAWASNFPEVLTTELYGADGGAQISGWEGMELFTMMNGQEVGIRNQPPSERGNSYFKLIENFVRRIDGDERADIPTPAQALVDVRIIDAIMRSAAEGHEVAI